MENVFVARDKELEFIPSVTDRRRLSVLYRSNSGYDQNLGVNLRELTEMTIAGLSKCNVKVVKKVQSQDNKCVQLADFVAGSIRTRYEYGDSSFADIISEKVSFAHEP